MLTAVMWCLTPRADVSPRKTEGDRSVRRGRLSLPRFGGQSDYAASWFANNLKSNSTGLM
jgi:hypothetical protein